MIWQFFAADLAGFAGESRVFFLFGIFWARFFLRIKKRKWRGRESGLHRRPKSDSFSQGHWELRLITLHAGHRELRTEEKVHLGGIHPKSRMHLRLIKLADTAQHSPKCPGRTPDCVMHACVYREVACVIGRIVYCHHHVRDRSLSPPNGRVGEPSMDEHVATRHWMG